MANTFATRPRHPLQAAAFGSLRSGPSGPAPPSERQPWHPGRRGRHAWLLRAHLDRVPLAGHDADGRPTLKLRSVYVNPSLTRVDAAEPELPLLAADREGLSGRLARRRPTVGLLIGEAGAGKSAALASLALDAIENRSARRRIPLFVDLSTTSTSNPPDLPEALAASPWLEGSTPASWFARRLRRGRCLVLIDGLDEIGEDAARERAVSWVAEQIDRYRRNSFLVAGRDPENAPELAGRPRWRLRRFGHAQISQFLERWQRHADVGASRREALVEAGVLLSRLHSGPRRFELAANPLRLTLTALISRTAGFTPETEQELLAQVADQLVHGPGGASGGIGRRGAHKETALRRLARSLADQGRSRVDHAEALRWIAESLKGVQAGLTPEEALDEAMLTGLLRRDSAGLGFSHQRLQEYLTAQDFHERFGDAKLASKIDHAWWRGVIELWAGMTDASRAVRACLQSGAPGAVALAFDCARQTRALDPQLRAGLDQLLHATSADPEQNATLGAAKARRELAASVGLAGGRVMTAEPVSRDLYGSFLACEHPGNCFVDRPELRTAPALGMWASDAENFANWIDRLPLRQDGRYRLPTLAEAADPLVDLPRAAPGLAVWIAEPDSPARLLRPAGAADAFALPRGWLADRAGADRRRCGLPLYLVSTAVEIRRSTLTRDLTGAADLNRERSFALPDELRRDDELREARRRLNRRDFDLGSAPLAVRSAVAVIHESVLSRLGQDWRGPRAAADPDGPAAAPFAFLDDLAAEEVRLLALACTVQRLCGQPGRETARWGEALVEYDRRLTPAPVTREADRVRRCSPERLRAELDRLCTAVAAGAEAHPGLLLPSLAAELVDAAARRLDKVLRHGAGYDAALIAAVRPAVAAAALAWHRFADAAGAGVATPEELNPALARVLAGLSVLELRAEGVVPPNEAIFLVRD